MLKFDSSIFLDPQNKPKYFIGCSKHTGTSPYRIVEKNLLDLQVTSRWHLDAELPSLFISVLKNWWYWLQHQSQLKIRRLISYNFFLKFGVTGWLGIFVIKTINWIIKLFTVIVFIIFVVTFSSQSLLRHLKTLFGCAVFGKTIVCNSVTFTNSQISKKKTITKIKPQLYNALR